MGYLKDELAGFVPVEQATEIMKDVARGSSILRLSKVSQMESDTKKIPVMTEGAGAYWVGEGERIKTSKAGWIYPELKAKKLAVIIPVTKEKLNDTTIDVFSELKESIAEAFYKAIDAAAIFGTNSPFERNIMKCVEKAGNKIEIGTNGEGKLDLDVADAMATVEDAGYDVNGFAAKIGIKNSLRKLRDGNGNQLFVDGVNGKELYSQPIEFSRNGAWDKTKAELVGADWDKSLVGIRDSLEYEILKEATLEGTVDNDGKPISLAEQDLIGIKATMRLAYLPIKDEAFCAVVPAGSLGELTVTSAEGTATGKTAITVEPAKTEGNSYKYKVAANPTMPKYGDVCTSGYTNWNGTDEISGTAGQKIVVVEVDSDNKAKRAGIATLTVKAD
jgi:HK97 family phage major capsid protein|nr:MAG TPA: Major capsid protein [Caudoviricetes sp.]